MTDQTSEDFGSVQNGSEEFGNVPHASEEFRSIPHNSESFRSVRKGAERTQHHTLTVREVARLFENAGVARTERSITNWCQENRQGIARLDAFYDSNERRYYVTPQSVHLAIQEEKAKQTTPTAKSVNEEPGPGASERNASGSEKGDENFTATGEMRRKITDLEITNRVKDQFIEMLQKDRDRLIRDGEGHVKQLISQSRVIGQLEAQVFQLGGKPASEQLPNSSASRVIEATEKAEGGSVSEP